MLASHEPDPHTLAELVEHIHGCLVSPREGLPSALSWLQNVTYCESIVLCHLCLADRIRFKHLVNHSYQPQWIRTYLAEDFADVDPVIRYAQSTSGIYSWQDAYTHLGRDCPKTFFEAAADFGLQSGFACCFRQSSSPSVTVCSLCAEATTLAPVAQWALNHLVPVLHAAACGLDTGTPKQALSRREREVLKWASDGKTVWEIGKILSLSEGTVKFHLGNIYKKLGVINRAQGIATAVRYDLI